VTIKNSDHCCRIWNAKIAHRAWQALHPLADGALQLKYDLLIAEKRYDQGTSSLIKLMTSRGVGESLQNRER